METNEKFLSLPPYLSTSWRNVRSIRMQDSDLVITLTDGQTVTIPAPQEAVVEKVFACHASFLEKQNNFGESRPAMPKAGRVPGLSEFLEGGGGTQLRFGLGGMDGLGNALAHNPAQGNAPDLPPDMLEKIASIAKIVVPEEDPDMMPKPEPHCNCMYCQIARAIRGGASEEEQQEEEEVTDEDLKFREWDIESCGDKLYQVTNPMNPEESYRVFLGEPVGCTCGQPNCEHLLAVLRS